MALRCFTRTFWQMATRRNFYSTISHRTSFVVQQRPIVPFRTFASTQNQDDAYGDLNRFLDKEIQLEKSAQKHPSKLPKVQGFEVQQNGPEVILTRQTGKDKVTVKFNVTNTVNASDSGDDAAGQTAAPAAGENEEASSQSSSQLKSRPTFTVDLNRGGETLSFLCSFLPDDYPEMSSGGGETGQQQGEDSTSNLEDFQIDEFAIHNGEWNDKVYSADCSVIDGELYDKLLNLLEEHGIGEEFANQLMDFSTAYEHRQYIGLLEKLQKFTK